MLTRLVLTDFRNHAAATIDARPGFIVLTGDNGAGKTNVLEAISLLAPGRGLRGAPLSQMARQGGPGGFGVAATLQLGTADPVRLGTGTRAAAPERRLVRINGAAAAASALAEWLRVLWLTPAMDRLFLSPAAERRRFLDRLTLALAPGHAHHAARYEAAMRARNRLLSEERGADPQWLDALERAMAEHGSAIAAARRGTVARLQARLVEGAAGFPSADLAIEGPDTGDLATTLAASRRRDAAAGRTLVGPHRDDLAVIHRDKRQPAALCSTGEQKALLFGIVLAHARLVADETGTAPVLLLDEVAAHLDPGRRAALFAALAGIGQTWVTGTECTLFADVPGPVTRLRVADGAIEN